jgi:hypothetical protein
MVDPNDLPVGFSFSHIGLYDLHLVLLGCVVDGRPIFPGIQQEICIILMMIKSHTERLLFWDYLISIFKPESTGRQ